MFYHKSTINPHEKPTFSGFPRLSLAIHGVHHRTVAGGVLQRGGQDFPAGGPGEQQKRLGDRRREALPSFLLGQ